MTIVGLISDTHGLLRREAIAALEDVDLIIHAGDIGSATVIRELAQLAPVHAIKGNIDKGKWAQPLPDDDVVIVDGRYIYVIHRLQDLDLDPETTGFDVVVTGHSHQPEIRHADNVLFVNPGSAGPRRFKLPVALAKLDISTNGIQARVVELSV